VVDVRLEGKVGRLSKAHTTRSRSSRSWIGDLAAKSASFRQLGVEGQLIRCDE
jgi:hypothetical protein